MNHFKLFFWPSLDLPPQYAYFHGAYTLDEVDEMFPYAVVVALS